MKNTISSISSANCAQLQAADEGGHLARQPDEAHRQREEGAPARIRPIMQ
jgi:hypothetical protein